jgi:hypothetical protein
MDSRDIMRRVCEKNLRHRFGLIVHGLRNGKDDVVDTELRALAPYEAILLIDYTFACLDSPEEANSLTKLYINM